MKAVRRRPVPRLDTGRGLVRDIGDEKETMAHQGFPLILVVLYELKEE